LSGANALAYFGREEKCFIAFTIETGRNMVQKLTKFKKKKSISTFLEKLSVMAAQTLNLDILN
jgi:hypothetical protein